MKARPKPTATACWSRSGAARPRLRPDRRLRPERPRLPAPPGKPPRVSRPTGRHRGPAGQETAIAARSFGLAGRTVRMAGQGARPRPAAGLPGVPDPGDREGRPASPARRRICAPSANVLQERRKDLGLAGQGPRAGLLRRAVPVRAGREGAPRPRARAGRVRSLHRRVPRRPGEPAVDRRPRRAADVLMRYKDRQDLNPERLEAIEERLSLIEGLKRKYGGGLGRRSTSVAELRRARRTWSGSRKRWPRRRGHRPAPAPAIAKLAAGSVRGPGQDRPRAGRGHRAEIGMLGMKKARFEIRVATASPDPLESADAGPRQRLGRGRVPDRSEPGRAAQAAAPDRLGRRAVAHHAGAEGRQGREKEPAKTLIFDEIDAGIGGQTAEFVAQKAAAARPGPPGHLHHPSAPDRLARRPPLPDREADREGPDLHLRPEPWRARSGSRRSPA